MKTQNQITLRKCERLWKSGILNLRKGWHVTDIALCPRQRVFKVIDPLPLTDKELNMYSSGRAVHEAVQWLFMSNPGRYEKEKYVE